jgi:hypothetical protein
MLVRIVWTVVTLIAASIAHAMWGTTHTILSAESAGTQFANSDIAAVANAGFQDALLFVNGGITIAVIMILYFIWQGYFKTAK